MPTYQLLTDRTLANVTAITPTTLIHIVTTADTTQSIYGSSYKAELQQLLTIFKDSFVSGATYNNNLFTFTNTTGGTFNVLFNTVTGLTVNGNLIVTGTTLSNTISATTYQNLPTDVRVTGGTYSNGTATFTNSTGGTFNVTGFFTGSTDVRVTGATYSNNSFTYRNNTGGTFSVLFNTVTGLTTNGNLTVTGTTSSNTISATTYQNLPTDVRVTGVTYSSNTFTYTNNTGGTFNILFNTVTGLTVNGDLVVTGNTGLGITSPLTKLDIAALNTTTAVNNTLRFTDTDTGAGTQFNGKIEFYSSDVSGVGVKSYVGGIINSSSQGSLIFATTGTTGSLSGGTIVGERMRIDSSGNVGIGDSSPTYRLEVSTGTETADQIGFHVRNDNSKGLFIIPTAGDSGYNFNTRSGDTVVTTTQGEHLIVGAKDGAAFRFSGGTSSSVSGNTITTGNRIGIGTVFYDSTQQPSEALDINGSARFRAVGATAFFANLNITSDGTLTTATSDIRLKENIEPLTNSLEKLLQLSGVTYSWIGQEGKKIGFIAQEVEKVIPELVFTNNNTEDKIKGIHMDNITAVLVEAIKEQQKIIEELKLRISNLES